MTDPTQMPGQPSEEEMRAYLEQLREADAAGLVAEAFNLLATGAQVKLGRPDARALIDSLAGMVQGAGATLPPQIVEQMNSGIQQLQMAQVQAERDLEAQEGGGEAAEGVATGGSAEGQAAAPAPPRTSSPGQPGADKRMTDRLWVPGRDPGPPNTR